MCLLIHCKKEQSAELQMASDRFNLLSSSISIVMFPHSGIYAALHTFLIIYANRPQMDKNVSN